MSHDGHESPCVVMNSHRASCITHVDFLSLIVAHYNTWWLIMTYHDSGRLIITHSDSHYGDSWLLGLRNDYVIEIDKEILAWVMLMISYAFINKFLLDFFENFGISRLVRTWSIIIGGGFFLNNFKAILDDSLLFYGDMSHFSYYVTMVRWYRSHCVTMT